MANPISRTDKGRREGLSYKYLITSNAIHNPHNRRTPKADLRAELAEAARNTAALPLHSDGLPCNAGEGE